MTPLLIFVLVAVAIVVVGVILAFLSRRRRAAEEQRIHFASTPVPELSEDDIAYRIGIVGADRPAGMLEAGFEDAEAAAAVAAAAELGEPVPPAVAAPPVVPLRPAAPMAPAAPVCPGRADGPSRAARTFLAGCLRRAACRCRCRHRHAASSRRAGAAPVEALPAVAGLGGRAVRGGARDPRGDDVPAGDLEPAAVAVRVPVGDRDRPDPIPDRAAHLRPDRAADGAADRAPHGTAVALPVGARRPHRGADAQADAEEDASPDPASDASANAAPDAAADPETDTQADAEAAGGDDQGDPWVVLDTGSFYFVSTSTGGKISSYSWSFGEAP